MQHLNHALLSLFLIGTGTGLMAQPVRLTDINPGTEHAFPSGAAIEKIILGNNLFFVANDGMHGYELWTSDGTPDGTKLVKDIKPGSGSSDPKYLTPFNGKLYFSATDGISGAELWVSDGTESGTHMLKDLRGGAGSASPRYLTVMNNALFFAGDKTSSSTALWKTDGTEEGTVELNPGLFGSTAPQQLTAMGDRLYFAGPGGELWSSDGTNEGTVKVKEIAPGNPQPFINHMTSIEGKLYFLAEDEPLNDEPWVSDGTETGTMKLKEIAPGIEGSGAWKFFPFKEHVYFSADSKLWRTDGTPGGTALFKDITVFQASNDPAHFISNGANFFFPADDGTNGVELWQSDGTSAGTFMVKNIGSNFFSSDPQSFAFGPDGLLYFQASQSGYGAELWKSDGTSTGTLLVADLNPGPTHAQPQSLTLLNGALCFIADDGAHGRELWKLDLSTATEAPAAQEELFSIAPNPAKDDLNLTFLRVSATGYYNLRIFDRAGSVVLERQLAAPSSSGLTIPLSGLPSGLYLLQLTAGPRIQTEKLIKF